MSDEERRDQHPFESTVHIKKRPSMFVPLSGKEWDNLNERERFEKLRQLRELCIQKEMCVIGLLALRKGFQG